MTSFRVFSGFDPGQTSVLFQESSNNEPPQAFLLWLNSFGKSQQSPRHLDLLKTAHDQESNNIDDVQKLMQQLGLKHHFQEHKERDGFCKCCKCECEGGILWEDCWGQGANVWEGSGANCEAD